MASEWVPSAISTRRLEILLAVLIVALDQLTKAIVRDIVPLHESLQIIPGLLDVTYTRNTGMAFDFLNSVDFPLKTVVMAVVPAAVLAATSIYATSVAHHQLAARVGMALILGGAAANLVDRLVGGSVIDFVDVHWRANHFWVFNLADAAISVGVTTLLIDILLRGDQREQA